MVDEKTLPLALSELAERRSWFSKINAEQVLAWLEQKQLPLLGIDAARKLPDGDWELLLDCLDLSNEADRLATIEQGREFIAQRPGTDFMFEPVW